MKIGHRISEAGWRCDRDPVSSPLAFAGGIHLLESKIVAVDPARHDKSIRRGGDFRVAFEFGTFSRLMTSRAPKLDTIRADLHHSHGNSLWISIVEKGEERVALGVDLQAIVLGRAHAEIGQANA